MIKTFIATLLLAFSVASVASATEKSEGYILPALEKGAFDFKQPSPKISDEMYKEILKAYSEGDADAILVLDHLRKHYVETQKAQGLDEPEDVYMGCVLFQLGGLAAIKSVNFAEIVPILSGAPKPDGSGNYVQSDADAVVNSWTREQALTAFRLWVKTGDYAGECYSYIHHGFIAGIPGRTSLELKEASK